MNHVNGEIADAGGVERGERRVVHHDYFAWLESGLSDTVKETVPLLF
jgi:hypothetical protein